MAIQVIFCSILFKSSNLNRWHGGSGIQESDVVLLTASLKKFCNAQIACNTLRQLKPYIFLWLNNFTVHVQWLFFGVSRLKLQNFWIVDWSCVRIMLKTFFLPQTLLLSRKLKFKLVVLFYSSFYSTPSFLWFKTVLSGSLLAILSSALKPYFRTRTENVQHIFCFLITRIEAKWK